MNKVFNNIAYGQHDIDKRDKQIAELKAELIDALDYVYMIFDYDTKESLKILDRIKQLKGESE